VNREQHKDYNLMSETTSTSMRDHAAKVLREQTRQAKEAPADSAAVDRGSLTADQSDAALDFTLDGNEIRLDQGIAMRHFFPNADSQAYAIKYVCPNGPGAREVVGALMGIAKRTEDGESDLGPYIRAIGEFFMESRLTGERRYHTECFLPQGYAKQLRALLADPEAAPVKLDAVVCVEASGGKGVPYRYVILSRLNAQVSPALADMMASRSKRLTGRAEPATLAPPAPSPDKAAV
jgi:hypothetical protein